MWHDYPQFTYMDRAPAAGETVVGTRTAIGFGGKGANQAVQARLCGSSVAMVNMLGDDATGMQYLKKLDEIGIDTTHVTIAPGVPSGCAPIWVEKDGTNRIIVVPGANDMMTPEAAVSAIDSLDVAAVVIGQMEIPQAVTAAAFAAAKRKGAVTVLNPAPASSLIPELVEVEDWIIPNESEFALLATGSVSETQPTTEAIEAYAKTLAPRRLLVTLGVDGVALVDSGGQVQRLSPPPMREAVVDTTGAGDSFVGAFCHGLAIGLSELDACRLGMACASDSVTREGTQPSFPTHERCKALGIL